MNLEGTKPAYLPYIATTASTANPTEMDSLADSVEVLWITKKFGEAHEASFVEKMAAATTTVTSKPTPSQFTQTTGQVEHQVLDPILREEATLLLRKGLLEDVRRGDYKSLIAQIKRLPSICRLEALCIPKDIYDRTSERASVLYYLVSKNKEEEQVVVNTIHALAQLLPSPHHQELFVTELGWMPTTFHSLEHAVCYSTKVVVDALIHDLAKLLPSQDQQNLVLTEPGLEFLETSYSFHSLEHAVCHSTKAVVDALLHYVVSPKAQKRLVQWRKKGCAYGDLVGYGMQGYSMLDLAAQFCPLSVPSFFEKIPLEKWKIETNPFEKLQNNENENTFMHLLAQSMRTVSAQAPTGGYTDTAQVISRVYEQCHDESRFRELVKDRGFLGNTPLHCAVTNGDLAALLALLGPFKREEWKDLAKQKNMFGKTLLHLAPQAKDPKIPPFLKSLFSKAECDEILSVFIIFEKNDLRYVRGYMKGYVYKIF